MKRSALTLATILSLAIFVPLALLPSSAGAALLDQRSPGTLTVSQSGTDPEFIGSIEPGPAGGQSAGITEALMSNEVVAVGIILLFLATIIGGVELSRH